MSLALIQESAKEVRRLAIAGSPLAVGDFRLKKLIAPLEQAGAKVPVFAQVAKFIGDVVDGKEAAASANLLNLSTLLNAILYTQGQSGAAGEIHELEVFTTSCTSTRTTARVLKPLLQALTASGAGRLELIKSACERGSFSDLRLVDAAIGALGDGYPEVADYVAQTIMPAYGPGIIPRLRAVFDIKGKSQAARILQVMHGLDPAGTLELCKTTLEDGSVDVRAAAIACLGKHEDCLPLVLEQAKAKNKQLRAAALESLAGYDRPEVNQLFAELIAGKSLGDLTQPLRGARSLHVIKTLLDEGRRVHDLLVQGAAEQIQRFWEILDCLESRRDTVVEEFLLECLGRSEKIAKLKPAKNSTTSGEAVVIHEVWLLSGLGTAQARQAILDKRTQLPPAAFTAVLRSALHSWTAEQVFAEFSPLLELKKGAGREKSDELERAFYASRHGRSASFLDRSVADDEEPDEEFNVTWDSRWLDAAIKADRPEAVCSLARPGHKGVVTYLLRLVEAKGKLRLGLVIEALARCQYPKLTDLYLNLVAKGTKGSKRWDYDLQQLIETARYLPPADLPRLEEFAGKLDQNYQDHFLEAIAPLRPTNPPTEA